MEEDKQQDKNKKVTTEMKSMVALPAIDMWPIMEVGKHHDCMCRVRTPLITSHHAPPILHLTDDQLQIIWSSNNNNNDNKSKENFNKKYIITLRSKL